MNRSPRIYFIRPIAFPGPVKIGFSECPQARLEALMTWSPFRLEIAASIPGSLDLERNIHECLADHHSHREWFHPTPKVLLVVEQLIAGVPIEEALNLNDRRGNIRKGRAPLTLERRKYLSLKCRMRCALVKAEKIAGRRMFWDDATYSLCRRLEKWDGRSIEPRDLTAEIEVRLKQADHFMTAMPYWERRA